MIMCDLDLCNVCWSFVDMPTSSMVKNIKFDQNILILSNLCLNLGMT